MTARVKLYDREKELVPRLMGAQLASVKQTILSDEALDITNKSISTLADVYSSMTPSDGEVLTYDTTNGWQSEAAGGFTQVAIHLPKDVIQNVGGANGTVSYITWDATAVLKDTGFTHEDVTNPTRVQVDTTGRYSINWTVGITQGGTARTTFMSGLRINGTTASIRGRQRNYSRGSGYGDTALGMNTELDLTAGDYIECSITVDDTDGVYTSNTINTECEIIVRQLS